MQELDLNFSLELSDFSPLEINLDTDFETRYIKPPKSKEISESNLKFSKAEDLAREITDLKNKRIFVIVNGSFIFGDFIEAFVIINNLKVKRMVISTLSMSENNVDSLSILLNEGFVDSLDLIVSDYFFSHERNNLVPYIYQELDKQNKFQLSAASTHCKTCIFETHCGHFVVIHGSANLRSSGNIEQFVIEENRDLYEFNQTYQDAIIDRFKTIDKSIRGKELWNLINK